MEGISDLDLHLVGGIWHLYVTTRPIPMVVVYELGAAASSYVLDDVQSLQGDGLRPTATVFLSLSGQDIAVSLGTTDCLRQPYIERCGANSGLIRGAPNRSRDAGREVFIVDGGVHKLFDQRLIDRRRWSDHSNRPCDRQSGNPVSGRQRNAGIDA